jgi:hypothetical protein
MLAGIQETFWELVLELECSSLTPEIKIIVVLFQTDLCRSGYNEFKNLETRKMVQMQ